MVYNRVKTSTDVVTNTINSCSLAKLIGVLAASMSSSESFLLVNYRKRIIKTILNFLK